MQGWRPETLAKDRDFLRQCFLESKARNELSSFNDHVYSRLKVCTFAEIVRNIPHVETKVISLGCTRTCDVS